MYWYHGEDWPEKTSASAEKGGDVNLYIRGGILLRSYKLLLGLSFYSEGDEKPVCLDEPKTSSYVWKILGKAGGRKNYRRRCQQILYREM